ncbi:MAG: non-homologous end-joining DNA ligase, partial [Methanoregula sp.]|nr:non-homologous end-joining DNA ligase [Methanoregula sp.]
MAGSIRSEGKEPSLRDLTRVNLTNLGREMYPVLRVTKQEVITYYIRMAPHILPFVHNRPLTMHRFPGGVGGEAFYEKDAPQGTPDYVDLFTRYSETSDREVHFILCNNLDTLIWLANLASLELHVTLSMAAAYDSPDLLLFDIDPEPPLSFDDTIDVALIVHERLAEVGMQSYVKTSGKKGLHIVVPLKAGYHFEEIRTFAHNLGKKIARDTPGVVSEFPHSQDPGTIFIDYLQNAHGKTMAAPYSLRATDGATVS